MFSARLPLSVSLSLRGSRLGESAYDVLAVQIIHWLVGVQQLDDSLEVLTTLPELTHGILQISHTMLRSPSSALGSHPVFELSDLVLTQRSLFFFCQLQLDRFTRSAAASSYRVFTNLNQLVLHPRGCTRAQKSGNCGGANVHGVDGRLQ